MDGEHIIERILSEAAEKSSIMIAAAEQKTAELIADGNAKNAELLHEADIAIKKEVELFLKRKETASALAAKKRLLLGRRELVSEVFDLVLQKLNAMDKAAYKSFIVKLLSKNAAKGDKVLLGSRAPFSVSELSNEPIVNKMSLIIEEGGNFGGIILSDSVCDKNLTFEAIVKEAAENYEAEVASELFD